MSTSNGHRSHDCAPVMWAYGIPCPAMVSPNASQHKEDKLLYPDHYLVWYAKVDSGPHISVCTLVPTLVNEYACTVQCHILLGPYSTIGWNSLCAHLSQLWIMWKMLFSDCLSCTLLGEVSSCIFIECF